MEKKRMDYLDGLRILSSFMLVMLHVAAYQFYEPAVGSGNWQAMNIYNSLTRFCLPCFFLMSGALFLNPEKEVSIGKLYKKNILRLVTAYAFWLVFYACISPVNFADFLQRLLDAPYHMWYLRTLVVLYMLTPVIRPAMKNEKLVQYFLAIGLTCFVLLPALRYWPVAAPVANVLNETFPLEYFSGYLVYFVLGYYLSSHDFAKKTRTVMYVLGVLSFVCIAGLTAAWSLRAGQPVLPLYDNNAIPQAVYASAMFLWFRYEWPRLQWPKKHEGKIRKLASYTFGIYLMHAFLISVLDNKLGFSPMSFTAWLSVPAVTLVVLLTGLVGTIIISKIPVLNKYII